MRLAYSMERASRFESKYAESQERLVIDHETLAGMQITDTRQHSIPTPQATSGDQNKTKNQHQYQEYTPQQHQNPTETAALVIQ